MLKLIKGKLIYFQQLRATFQNKDDNYVSKETIVPDQFLLDVEGDEIFSETDDRVQPISDFFIGRG